MMYRRQFFFICFLGICELSAQVKHVTGFVKEIDPTQSHTVRPVTLLKVWLQRDQWTIQDYTTSNGSFDLKGYPRPPEMLALDTTNYYLTDNYYLTHFNWSDNVNNPVYFMLVSREKRIYARTEYFNTGIAKKEKVIRMSIREVKQDTAISLSLGEEKVERLREELFNHKTRVFLMADVFASTDLSAADPRYATALLCYKSEQSFRIDSILTDRFLDNKRPDLPSMLKLKSSAFIIKGEAKYRVSNDGPEKYYLAATTLDSQVHTSENYGNYLYDNNRFSEAISYFKKITDSPLLGFSDSIYTIAKLIRSLDSIDRDHDSSYRHSLALHGLSKDIFQSNDQLLQSSFIVSGKSMMRYNHLQALKSDRRKDWKKYIGSLQHLQGYYENEFIEYADSTLFWLADRGELKYEIAKTYDTNLHRKRKAASWYRRSISASYVQASNSDDPRYWEVLFKRYHAYLDAGHKINRKRKYIRTELRRIGKDVTIDPIFKVRLEQFLASKLN